MIHIAQHGHGGVSFAGCYYVHSGMREDSAMSTTSLELKKPGDNSSSLHAKTSQHQRGHDDDSVWSDTTLGRAGTLALWPGHIRHWVPPHTGELKRVSIAFNIEVTMHDASGSSMTVKNEADRRLEAKILELQQA